MAALRLVAVLADFRCRDAEHFPPLALQLKTMRNTLLTNMLLSVPFVFLAVWPLFKRSGFSMQAPLPGQPGINARRISHRIIADAGTVAWQLAVCVVLEDALFYWSHRLLHTPLLYRHVHKAGAVRVASLLTISDAPRVSCSGGIRRRAHAPARVAPWQPHPVLLRAPADRRRLPRHRPAGACCVRCCCASFMPMQLMLRIWKSCDGHSGLFLPFSPWNVISRDNARVHDFHHSHNRGSFGSFFHVRACLCFGLLQQHIMCRCGTGCAAPTRRTTSGRTAAPSSADPCKCNASARNPQAGPSSMSSAADGVATRS